MSCLVVKYAHLLPLISTGRDVGELLAKVEPDDLVKFGIIPELVGRLPILTCLQSLKKDDLVRILVEPKNALIKQYQKLLEMDHVVLEIQPEALDAIAQKAIDRSIGARGLRAVLEQVMLPIMYEIPSDLTIRKVTVTPECVQGGEPIWERTPGEPRKAVRS